MSELENNIVTWLTGKPTLADVSVSQLENIVSQYPYFTIAQLLLTAKLKEENHAGYERQLQKTALNFQDPKWLFFQLNQLTDFKKTDQDLSNISTVASVDEVIEKNTTANLEIIEIFNNNEKDNFNLEENIPEKNIQAEKEKVKAFLKSVIDRPHVQLEEKNSEIETPTTEIQEKIEIKENFNSTEAPVVAEDTFTEDLKEYIAEKEDPSKAIIEKEDNLENSISENIEDEETEIVEETQIPNASEIPDESEVPFKPIEKNISENVEQTNSDIENVAEPEPTEIEISKETPQEIEQVQPLSISNEENIPLVAESMLSEDEISDDKTKDELSEIDKNALASEEENLIGEKMSAKLANIASSFKSDVVPQQPLISEEATPAHLKDYFASIGVKVDNTIQTDFGQKVKKFTDWLKVMKKIGSNGTLIQTSEKEEKQVAQDAAKSNQNSDIVTQAMVDVLMKQGKKNEAIEILNRLSLLKPEKSAYFASQINDLNENK